MKEYAVPLGIIALLLLVFGQGCSNTQTRPTYRANQVQPQVQRQVYQQPRERVRVVYVMPPPRMMHQRHQAPRRMRQRPPTNYMPLRIVQRPIGVRVVSPGRSYQPARAYRPARSYRPAFAGYPRW